MMVSGGGFYEIQGSALRALSAVPAGPGAADGLRNRQIDLWAESSTLIRANHRLSGDELGLWGSMLRELDRIRRALNGLEQTAGGRAVTSGPRLADCADAPGKVPS
jgi:hypothetical protein